jgi:SRSO17 transposase
MDDIVRDWAQGLEQLHSRIAPHFRRAEPRRRAHAYLEAMISSCRRKNGWQLAERIGERSPDGVQRLLRTADWDVHAVRDELRSYVIEHLGDPSGVLIVDETGFLKQGTHSAGVARQYSGTAGRRENQQIGVFLAYASQRGCAFIDRALYLPEVWAADPARRAAVGIPPTVAFATKGDLARAMLAQAFSAQVPAAWVVGDTIYGHDELRRWLDEQGRRYVLAVPCSHAIWTQGQQVEARLLGAPLPADAWMRLAAGEGNQGPRWYDWACLALPYRHHGGWCHWLLIRRSVSDPAEQAYYRVCAPADTPVTEMVRVAGLRWAIEAGFAQAKEEVGLDQYEVRRWEAWYRHITLALLAHAYLEVTRATAPLLPTQKGAMPRWG